MGNTPPKNRTGRQATAQKLENATKLGVLSLTEHDLDEIPAKVFHPELSSKLRTLDLSRNKLSSLGKLELLTELKLLKIDYNRLRAGSCTALTKLTKLQTFSASHNQLGEAKDSKTQQTFVPDPLPTLPVTLRQVDLSYNSLQSVPPQLLSDRLVLLEKLDLSGNPIASVPVEIACLAGSLQELTLDHCCLVCLPEAMGSLLKLKVLSLRSNQFRIDQRGATKLTFSAQNPQPIPASILVDTGLIDLNLHGNDMTNTQLNQFEGFQAFLDRRQKVKNKTLSNLDASVCGLE